MKTEIPSQTLHSSVPSLAGYWIPKINQVHGDGIDATLRYARTVGEARRRLKFGEWTALCRSGEVAFGIRQGQYLVRIDKELGDLNADAHPDARLPWGWTTLYHLSFLPRATLLELIETRRINPRLTKAEAKRLVAELSGKKPKQPGKTSIKRRLKAINEWIEENLAGWAGDERDQVTSAFAEFIKRIRSNCAGAWVSSPAATCDVEGPLDFDSRSETSDALDHSTLLRVGTPTLRNSDSQFRIGQPLLETSSPEKKSL